VDAQPLFCINAQTAKKGVIPIAGKYTLRHLAMIMDGNGRWATARNQPRFMGHQAGYETMKRIIRLAPDYAIEALSFYAFSTENWGRPIEEVEFLMSLPLRFYEQDLAEMQQNGVRVIHSGRLDAVPDKTRHAIEQVVRETAQNDHLIVNLAFNYGGRAELVDAMRQIAAEVAAGGLQPEQLDEALIGARLYQPELPEPDLIVRASGEQRVSNFLLWQGAYSELYFSEKLWPDFDKEELERILEAYKQRNRRYGQV